MTAVMQTGVNGQSISGELEMTEVVQTQVDKSPTNVKMVMVTMTRTIISTECNQCCIETGNDSKGDQ